ncbi:MAG: hypothetical protein JO323_05695 [Acidobacteriia bacterium]|nr:hypothetical protein [Terriglobia bacterium]
MRTLYRFLVRLHPLDFRVEFGGEMLWIYDEAAATIGVFPLLTDALMSLGRQWLLRSDVWKFGIGVIVNATLLSVLFMGPGFRWGPPKKGSGTGSVQAGLGLAWALPDPPPHHYKLYLMVEKAPAWDRDPEK